jgi:glycerate-2-kinase
MALIENEKIELAEKYISEDSTGGPVTVNLRPAAIEGRGQIIHIKDEGGAAGTNTITVDAYDTETIDGSTTYAITTNYGSVTIRSDGFNWFTI